MGVAAVRADRARRPHLRPRRRRRQGGRHGAHRLAPRADRGDRRRLRPRRRAVLRGGGGGRLALVRAVPRPTTPTTLRADVIVVADSGNWDDEDPRADRVAARQHALHAARAHARPRLALRHVRRSGARRDDGDGQDCSRRCGTRTARSRSKASPSAMPRPRQYSEETLRDEAGPACGREPDRHRHDPQPASGTSRRSPSPGSTRRASRTPPTR